MYSHFLLRSFIPVIVWSYSRRGFGLFLSSSGPIRIVVQSFPRPFVPSCPRLVVQPFPRPFVPSRPCLVLDCFFVSLIHLDAHIRAHHGANGTPRTLPVRVVQDNELIPLIVDLPALPDEFVGTNVNAKDTALAFVSVNFDGRHKRVPNCLKKSDGRYVPGPWSQVPSPTSVIQHPTFKEKTGIGRTNRTGYPEPVTRHPF